MDSFTANRTRPLMQVQKLLGCKVENSRGESLGRIEDFMIGAEDGRIAYAVVSFGGVLSLGNKLFAFPWSSLQVDSPRRKVILNLDKKTLAEAHGFDKDHWPDSAEWNRGPGVLQVPAVPAPAPVREPIPIESAVTAEQRMELWGKSWQSHGLDRA